MNNEQTLIAQVQLILVKMNRQKLYLMDNPIIRIDELTEIQKDIEKREELIELLEAEKG